MRRTALSDILATVIPNAIRSSAHLTSNAIFLIAFTCIAHNVTGKSYIALTSYVPAFLSSFLVIFIERKSRRSELAMYIMSQAVWCLWRFAIENKIVKNLPAGEVLLWSLAMSAIMYAFATSPSSVHGAAKSILSFLCKPKTCDATAPAPQINDDWVYKRVASTATTAARAFGAGWALQAALSLIRVLTSGKISVNSIVKALAGSAHLRLASFFGGTSAVYWAARHILHGARKIDDGINSAIAGFLAGLPFGLMRSPSLALYLAAKGVEVCCTYRIYHLHTS